MFRNVTRGLNLNCCQQAEAHFHESTPPRYISAEGGAGFCAAQGTAGPGDSLEELKAVPVGEGLEDGGTAGAAEARGCRR